MTPNPDPLSAESEGSTLRSVRWKPDVFSDALDLADRMNWSFSFLANFALRDYICRDQDSTGEPPDLTTWADNGWRVMQESGSSGKGYELSLTFSLPNMGDADQSCYEIRERLISLLSEAGGRDVVTRLVALGSMMTEQRRPVIDVESGKEICSRCGPQTGLLATLRLQDGSGQCRHCYDAGPIVELSRRWQKPDEVVHSAPVGHSPDCLCDPCVHAGVEQVGSVAGHWVHCICELCTDD